MSLRPALALLLAGALAAGSATAGKLTVVGTHLESDAGSFVVRVYQDADSWLSERWRTQKVVAVAGQRRDGTVTVELLLPPGEYALSVFQDLDNDGKLLRNFLGMPKEPAGLSNNLRPKLGPPKFRDAKFTIGEVPVEQRIELR